ncbi:MAG: hypothetical protein A2639_00720 [Candidatus Staskawiczbacteria bacterium RIFCSPHIGHO2_01_FULL_34_27]|uniref:Uncharacterized protein n=2 Tax=Candidatus Staskawicziibacteriota TaxID=1817916 RepID=A0A1G2HIK8_9BACT|nr:MAG: hypothetical protein A2639_00720 [Candidatus Staskawiczbacteria bacterium RIFCSPHIGHO2_01_FULL_34_27]OGZ69011.1 MAG: hypothetical protein A3D35_02645 [Candidatus Staskawiczbacteria bacterium RIFCSPHIGHO2_02_FULL_34_9]
MIKVNKIQIYSIVFSIIALLLVVFLVYPTIKDIKYNSDKILENKSQIFYADEQNKAIEEFKKSYSNYESNFMKIDQTLVDPNNPIDVIKFFELSGLESRLTLNITLIDSGKKENLNGFNLINFNINTNGNFSDIVNLSEKLEKGPYLVKIKSLSMNKSSVDNKDNGVDAQFSVYVATQNPQ